MRDETNYLETREQQPLPKIYIYLVRIEQFREALTEVVRLDVTRVLLRFPSLF